MIPSSLLDAFQSVLGNYHIWTDRLESPPLLPQPCLPFALATSEIFKFDVSERLLS